MITINTITREPKEKGKQLRRVGYIPAIVYGHGLKENFLIKLEHHEIVHALKSTHIGSQVSLKLGKETKHALIKEIRIDPKSYRLEHLDFQLLNKGEVISVTVPILLKGEDKVPAGGIIQQIEGELHYRAMPKDLMDEIVIDISSMKIGDAIKVKDLPMFGNKNYHLDLDGEHDLVILSEPKIEMVAEAESTVTEPVMPPLVGESED